MAILNPAGEDWPVRDRTASPRLLLVFVLSTVLCGGCTHLPDINGMPLPNLSAEAPTSYRSLTDIPDPPPVTEPGVSEMAMGALSEQRGSTEQAADRLRAEPFINPAPAQVQNPF